MMNTQPLDFDETLDAIYRGLDIMTVASEENDAFQDYRALSSIWTNLIVLLLRSYCEITSNIRVEIHNGIGFIECLESKLTKFRKKVRSLTKSNCDNEDRTAVINIFLDNDPHQEGFGFRVQIKFKLQQENGKFRLNLDGTDVYNTAIFA